ncbi:MAG: pyrroline-5-carboxylate reductase [Treponema sp.]|nr:pyrroline-5-carboxylate reductase [Treponema sp.]
MKITFIGCGNMGFALMKGIAETSNNTIKNPEFSLFDIDTDKALSMSAAIGGKIHKSIIEAAETGDYIFLAVKPQVMEEVLSEIAPVLQERLTAGDAPVLVSMAAGWPIEKIQSAVGGMKKNPVVRIMPNTPALVSKGMIAMAVSPELSDEKAAILETMLKGAGSVDRIDENYLNAVTALSGSGPAFVCLFIEALADGGVLTGLPRGKAIDYAVQTVLGTAALVQETGKHPAELKDAVCSPGGTTIAGVNALEAGAFRSSVIKAVEAAYRRARELS